jgi:hypothetical protein
MTTPLQLFPARVAIGRASDGTLIYASDEFLRALQKLFERVGGATGPSTTDLATSDDEDSGLEEFRAEQLKHNDALEMLPLPVFDSVSDPQLPPVVFPEFTDPLHPLAQEPQEFSDPLHPLVQEQITVDVLLSELSGLREEVAQLRIQINDLQQGTYL